MEVGKDLLHILFRLQVSEPAYVKEVVLWHGLSLVLLCAVGDAGTVTLHYVPELVSLVENFFLGVLDAGHGSDSSSCGRSMSAQGSAQM